VSVGTETPSGPGTSSVPGSGRARVTVVLVVHDGAEWLPRTLAALAGSLRRPDLVVAVDAGSHDRSPVLLDTAVGLAPGRVVDAVVTGEARDGFGRSVARGLAAADALREEQAAGGQGLGAATGEEWVWLLHDDSAPEPEALDELLSVAVASPTLGVAGCKLVGWDDPTRLVEVGATVSPGGRRLTDVVPGDIDQGQHDSRGDVLVVSTAGMLVRRSVLDHVGGFDPALPLVGEDVDLCLRVRRAGHRVAVVPTAAVRHVAALERGVRPADALHGRLARRSGAPAPRAGGRGVGLESARRRHWLHARLVQAPLLLVPFLWLWVLAVAPARSLVWLLRGYPGHAWAELDAAARLLARGWRVSGSRYRARRARVVPASALRPLHRSRGQVLREDLDAWRARRSLRREGDLGHDEDHEVPLEAVESGPVDEDLIDLDLGAAGPTRRMLGHPLTYLIPLALLLGVLPLLRGLLVGGASADGAATPPAEAVERAEPTAGLDAAELWARAVSDWRDVGMGQVGAADPVTTVWAGLTAATSLASRGAVDVATIGDARTGVLLLAPLVSLLLAYAVLRPLVRSRAAAGAGAAVWAALPATGLLGEQHAGDLVVHALLPLLLAALAGCLGRRPVRCAAATALLSSVVVALAPGNWPVLVVTAVLVGVLGGARSLATWRACLPLLAVAGPLLWAPWVPALRRDPRLLLLDPAGVDPTAVPLPTAAGLLDTAAPVLAVATGGPWTGGAVAVLVAAALVLLALAALLGAALVVAALARARVPAAWSALAVALVAGGVGVAAVVVARSIGGQASVPASAAALALLVVVALLVRDLNDPDRPSPRDQGGSRRVLAAVVGAARVLVPLGVVCAAAAAALVVPAPVAPDGLPAPALVGAESPQATRSLLLRSGDGDRTAEPVLVWSVTGSQPGPGQASVATGPADARRGVRPGDRLLADVVASALGDGPVAGQDVAGTLADLGVGWVVVSGSPDVDTALAQRAGLVRTAVDAGRTTWRVDTAGLSAPPPARVRVVDAAGDAVLALDPDELSAGTAVLPDGGPGRTLVLAENARDGWSARVDGTALSATTVDGWAQGFLLPATGGDLEVLAPTARPTARLVSLVAAGVLALLLLWPGRLRDRLDDRGRRPVPSPGRRRDLVLRRSGRGLAGVAATLLVVTLLALSTGVGTGAGRWHLDDRAAGLAAGTPVGDVAERALAAVDDRWPVAADPASGAPLVMLDVAGEVQTCPATVDDPAVPFAAADGEDDLLPRGLTSSVSREGDERGLALAACPVTAPSTWVVLGGTAVGERPSLLLSNPGETGAVVDVRVGGESGPVATPASTGLLVAPGEQVEVALDALAPDLAAVLARVDARSGTVAVTGRDSGLAGLVPQGGDSQTGQTAPSTALVLPAVRVPSTLGDARLLVGSVGEQPAVVRLSAVPVTVDGVDPGDEGDAAVPAELDLGGLGTVVAPGGGVTSVDLSDLPDGTYSLRLEADVPIVASASWSRQRGGEPAEGLTGVPVDRTWVQGLPAGSPWTTPVRLDLTGLRPQEAALSGAVLTLQPETAVDQAVEVALRDGDGQVLVRRDVDLSGGGSRDVRLADLLGGLPEGAGTESVADLTVSASEGVHLGLRVQVDDVDGPLLGATSVPGPPPSSPTVLLVRG
jgi:GT2 family glycosyltransferase